ncbi:MAG: DoxX family membrane protein [Acetobacteraceae bacterium]|nr:MAG: DoxX family membrane protein [Acetobacteraceae bacterium]
MFGNHLTLFGRCAFVWFYMTAAMNILGDWHGMAALLTAKSVPLAPLVLLLVLLVMFMGSLSLLFGYHTRYGAVMLFGLTIIGAVVLHDFWRISDGAARVAELGIFARDIAIAGGLLLMVGMGPGPFAIDNRGKGGGGKRR